MLKYSLSVTFIFIFALCLKAQDFQRSIDIGPGKELKVDITTGGSIHVEGWNNNQVKIEVNSRRGDINENDIEINTNSKGVYIEVRQTGHNSGNLDFHVYVPLKFDLDLETMGGEISIANVEGKINGQTMGGSLDLKSLNGEITMTTMGGSIDLRDS
ncbi:MAG: hypothetical protein P8X42_09585, partial [Calditrichaceae bacterium]